MGWEGETRSFIFLVYIWMGAWMDGWIDVCTCIYIVYKK